MAGAGSGGGALGGVDLFRFQTALNTVLAIPNREEKMSYEITYFDPLDEEGMRVKTWQFKTRAEAEAWIEELPQQVREKTGRN
jgi:hypothetical protein